MRARVLQRGVNRSQPPRGSLNAAKAKVNADEVRYGRISLWTVHRNNVTIDVGPDRPPKAKTMIAPEKDRHVDLD